MKISIALCTYNGENFLPEQLESIRLQTRLPDEVVVCDDCSSDSTVAIVQRFATDSPFPVRLYINETNLRSTKNFEKAISLCEGDIIALCDQDDFWLPEKIHLFEAEFLRDSTVGMVFCNGEIVDQQLISLNYTSWDLIGFESNRFQHFASNKFFEELLESNFVSGCMMAFRAEFKKLILPIPIGLPGVIHDYWIALLLSAVSHTVPLTSAPLVQYRQHQGQQIGLDPRVILQAQASLAEEIPQKAIFAGELLRMEPIAERLKDCSKEFPCEKTLIYLNQYIDHIRARMALQNKESSRIVTVFNELASRRYHRYSNGIKSAVRDLTL